MSIPLGGFSYRVDADVSPAQRAFQQLAQQARQAGRQIEQAFAAQVRPRVDARAAEQGIQRLEQAARKLREQAATITVRANLNEADAGLSKLAAKARELGNARLNLTVNAGATKQAEQALDRLASSLRSAKSGERIHVTVQADGVAQAEAAIRRLGASINAAKAAGARVAVNVQTAQPGQAGSSFFQ